MSIARQARLMLRSHRHGVLSTLSKRFDGHPFGSIVPFLADHDGSLLILVSALAEHTRNILHDPRVSLIAHDPRDPDVQAQGRVTVLGEARPETERERAGQRYVRYFPEAAALLQMGDFSFCRIIPAAIRYIAGFGKIHWVDMQDYAVPEAGAFALEEAHLLAELNAPRNDVLQRWLRRHGIEVAEAQAIGMDCDGIDVCGDGKLLRLDFPEAASGPSPDALLR